MGNLVYQKKKVILFQSHSIRRAWYNETWFYALVDIVGALTESANPTDYLKKLRKRDEELRSRYEITFTSIRANWVVLCSSTRRENCP